MKIAVIGAGVAGMAAAWRLCELHDVTVYEKAAAPGGHAFTVEVSAEGPTGTATPTDLGFQLYHERFNPNFQALLELLDVPSEAVEFSLSVSSGTDAWSNNGHPTPFADALLPEISRFLRDLPAIARLGMETSLHELFRSRGYSPDFRHKCLAPLLSFWWVSRLGLFDMPAVAVAAGVQQGALSFFCPTTWRRVRGGVSQYVSRLSARLSDSIRLATAAQRIERTPSVVRVVDSVGRTEAFDQVVLATDAAEALLLLAQPSPQERDILGSIAFESSELIVHRDERMMPRDRALWSYGNYRDDGAYARPGALTGEMTYWPPRAGSPSIFVTVATPATRIDPGTIVMRRSWRHMRVDTALPARNFAAIQGRHRTWFCGGHTVGYPVHEHALCAGLAVAEALGASYPFAAIPLAGEAYRAVASRIL